MPSNSNTNQDQRIDEKRLPIVFLLDVSGSMLFDTPDGRTKLDTMNEFVADFIGCCLTHNKARLHGDVCFILFTDKVIMESSFRAINRLNGNLPLEYRLPECDVISWTKPVTVGGSTISIPQFSISKRDNGTNIGQAVLRGVELIEQRVRASGNHTPYPPMLILVSDGHPVADNQIDSGNDLVSQRLAIQALLRHQETHRDQCNLIIPLVVPVGVQQYSANADRLQKYVEHFDAGYSPYSDQTKDTCLTLAKEIMARSITNSRTLTSLADVVVSEKHNPN